MSAESENSKTSPPNDRLREVAIPRGGNDGMVPEVATLGSFVLLKLNGYFKPPLAEELSDPRGADYAGGCTCNSVCPCVPVQACACDTVCTCDAVATFSSERSGGAGGGYGGYYAPCF